MASKPYYRWEWSVLEIYWATLLAGPYTGRKCDDPRCNGHLKDTIVAFGESLPEDELTKAFQEGEEADLCLSMGSSLTVTPAADIPKVSIHWMVVNNVSMYQSVIGSIRGLLNEDKN